MSITLTRTDTSATCTLHPDLMWSDENAWAPVEQAVARTITGALDIQVAGRIAGRPITLEPENDSSAWMPRSDVDTLRNWAAVPGLAMTLTVHGVTRDVIFRHQDGGFEATPVVHWRDVQSGDWYLCTIRLMEV